MLLYVSLPRILPFHRIINFTAAFYSFLDSLCNSFIVFFSLVFNLISLLWSFSFLSFWYAGWP